MKRYTTHVREEQDKWVYENAVISKASIGDAEVLAPKLRKPDLAEIQAATGEKPLKILKESITGSKECYTVWSLDETLIYGAFGAAPLKDKTGLIWFLGSDDLFNSNKVSFLRNSHIWVDKLMENYDVLLNVVDCRNKVHIRWLKWLGFTFTEVIEEFGYEQRPFIQFFKKKEK